MLTEVTNLLTPFAKLFGATSGKLIQWDGIHACTITVLPQPIVIWTDVHETDICIELILVAK